MKYLNEVELQLVALQFHEFEAFYLNLHRSILSYA